MAKRTKKKKDNKAENTPTQDAQTPEVQASGKNGKEVKNEEATIEIEGQNESAELEVETGSEEGEKEVSLQSQVEKLQDALKEATDQNLRLNADFINFRKRKEKEMGDVVRFANQELIKQLLPILDNFDRTLQAIDKTDNLSAIKEGIEGVSRNMQRTLEKIGVVPIEAIGQPFNSEIHEAITSIPVEDEEQKDKVVDEIEKGYKLKDKVVRFSKVIIGE